MQRRSRAPTLTLVLLLSATTSGWAQGARVVPRSAHASLLDTQVSIDVRDVAVATGLMELHEASGVPISFSPTMLPPYPRVSCTCRDVTLGAALDQLLSDSDFEPIEMTGQIVIVRASPPRASGLALGTFAAFDPHRDRTRVMRLAQSVTELEQRAVRAGSIAGRVTDAGTGTGISGANVRLQDTGLGTTTAADGRYRLADVPVGEYSVVVERIGYGSVTHAVSVADGAEATIDFELNEAAVALDELVVTGTMVPTAVKALPNPVTVVSESEIAAQRPRTVQQLFRQVVPTAVAWAVPANPQQTAYSVRGTSMIGGGGSGQMKVFVDGILVASNTFAAVDPNSIARIEVIRGPQAAAIYGSDALGGVVQIFTKRGDPDARDPRVDAEAAVGVIQTPYDGYERVVRQSYKASILGGGEGISYNFGAGYSHTPDWVVPSTSQSRPSAYGGVHITRGIFTADLSGRYHIQNFGAAVDPSLTSTGLDLAAPFYQRQELKAETLGASLGLAPTGWWTHKLTAGIDRNASGSRQVRPRLTTPADTLLQASQQANTREFIQYSSSVHGDLGSNVSGSLVVGFDHYDQLITSWITSSASNTEGTIVSASPLSANRTTTKNTGYFAQSQLAIRDQLFFTVGLRAEKNTHFGDSLSTPVSRRFGLSYAPSIGLATVKLRGSWGSAIRPPNAGFKSGMVQGNVMTLPNPKLGPEEQKGWDAGVDATIGSRGSISVTYYDQSALDLVQQLLLSAEGGTFTYQHQNVGRVENSGIEIEARANLGPLRLSGQYGYTRSRIADLGPNYSGDLEVGDAPIAVPKHGAGISLQADPRTGTSLSAGLTYVGAFRGYDLQAVYSCWAETAPCRPGPGLRSYLFTVPGHTQVDVTAAQQITDVFSAFLSVENLTNSLGREFTTGVPVMGRITTLGLRLQF